MGEQHDPAKDADRLGELGHPGRIRLGEGALVPDPFVGRGDRFLAPVEVPEGGHQPFRGLGRVLEHVGLQGHHALVELARLRRDG